MSTTTPAARSQSLSDGRFADLAVRARRRRRRERVTVRGAQLAVVVAFVGAWQLVVSQGWIDPVLAKTPGETWSYLRTAALEGELWSNTRSTLAAVLISFVLAGVAGTAVGAVLGLFPRTERTVAPILDAFNAMPRIALAPVFIIYFGIGTSAKVALAASLAFFIVASGAQAGVRSADAEFLRMAAILGAGRRQVITTILLPGAVPSIFAALRMGLIYSLLGVIGSEIITSKSGLGQLISMYSGQFRMDAVYGILLYLALLASVLNQVTALLERRLLQWQPPREHS